jgi:2'-hydroxyisoflavone reductase
MVIPLRVLVLGGTGFLGPAYVQASRARGHRVAVFNRGKGTTDLPADVERLVGDRSRDLEAIQRRDWDAVIDVAAYEPLWVRLLGQAIGDRVGHYTYVSSIAVYKDPPQTGAEEDELKQWQRETDPFGPAREGVAEDFASASDERKRDMLYDYGARKAIAEIEGARQFSGRSLVVRPGTLIGPNDDTNHVYWFDRLLRGGDVLVPGSPSDPFQYIDVLDLAEWTMRLIEEGTTGTFNGVGLDEPLSWGEFVRAIAVRGGAPFNLHFVESEWLLEQGVRQTELPLWFPFPDRPAPEVLEWASMEIKNDLARSHGLRFRPLEHTVSRCLSGFQLRPPRMPPGWGLAPLRERQLLDLRNSRS